VASGLVPLSPDRASRSRALNRDTVLCFWARNVTHKVPPSSQEYTCDGLAFRPGGVEILLGASCYGNRDKLWQLSYNLRKKSCIPCHFCNICQGLLSLRPLSPNSVLFIVMRSSLPAYNIVGCCGGGGRRWSSIYSNDVMRYNCLVNALSCYLTQVCRGLLSRIVVGSRASLSSLTIYINFVLLCTYFIYNSMHEKNFSNFVG